MNECRRPASGSDFYWTAAAALHCRQAPRLPLVSNPAKQQQIQCQVLMAVSLRPHPWLKSSQRGAATVVRLIHVSLHSFGMFISQGPEGALTLLTQLDKTSLLGRNLALATWLILSKCCMSSLVLLLKQKEITWYQVIKYFIRDLKLGHFRCPEKWHAEKSTCY